MTFGFDLGPRVDLGGSGTQRQARSAERCELCQLTRRLLTAHPSHERRHSVEIGHGGDREHVVAKVSEQAAEGTEVGGGTFDVFLT